MLGMNVLRLLIPAAIIGASVGVAVGYYEVGQVEKAFAPPLTDANRSLGASEVGANNALPRVEVDAINYDFGTMQRGATKSHEFIFTNTGEGLLQLTVGATSCKCTVGEVDDTSLAPGESTPVKLEWVAKTGVGDFSQTATIRTNDPRNSMLTLTVSGVVTDTTGLDPQEFLLGKITTNESRTAEVYLAAYGDIPLEATATMADRTQRPELFELEVEPVKDLSIVPLKAATSAVILRLTTKPGLPLGMVTEWVEVKTNLPEADIVRVPVIGGVEGDISIHGRGWAKNLDVVLMGKVPRDKGKEANLIISFKGESADNASASVGTLSPEWLEVSVGEPKQVRDGVKHIPLKIRIPAGQLPVIHNGQGEAEGGQGQGDARVQILTQSPSTPEVDIRVRFIIE